MRSEQLIRALALIGATAALGVGCVAHATAGGYAEAEAPVVFVEPPTLVEVDADVWVVRDYDYPVYYTGGFYWVYRDNIWWRSEMYDKGWARIEVSVVPQVVVQRDHHIYVHYKGSANAKTRVAPRERLAADNEQRRGPPDQAGPPDRPGPPDHAAAPHGGPPGQDETPGVGNQRKAEEGNPGVGNKKDEPPGQGKKEEAKPPKKEDKKGGPGGPKKK